MEIDVLYNTKYSVDNTPVPLEQSGYYTPSTAGSTGIDYGSYYGKIQQDAINAQNETDAEKLRQQKIANRKYDKEILCSPNRPRSGGGHRGNIGNAGSEYGRNDGKTWKKEWRRGR